MELKYLEIQGQLLFAPLCLCISVFPYLCGMYKPSGLVKHARKGTFRTKIQNIFYPVSCSFVYHQPVLLQSDGSRSNFSCGAPRDTNRLLKDSTAVLLSEVTTR